MYAAPDAFMAHVNEAVEEFILTMAFGRDEDERPFLGLGSYITTYPVEP